jgi:L-ascorbate oxidase
VLSRACYNCAKQNVADCFRQQCVVADGLKRTIEVVNRILPGMKLLLWTKVNKLIRTVKLNCKKGPSIQVCLGDTIVVNVHNALRSYRTTAIHWHGMKQKGTPYMDGAPLITQCPIMPYGSFQYRSECASFFFHFLLFHYARKI